MSGISMPQGELIVGNVLYKTAMNCMVVPFDKPEEWYMVQFLSTTEIEKYAADYNLVIRKEG
jgi:hypothetical protein